MKVLITGIGGFIASHILKLLDAHEIRGVDSLDPRVHHGKKPKHWDERTMDRRDYANTDPSWLAGVDTVIHLAAQVSVADSAVDPCRYIIENTDGTARFLQMLPPTVERLVVASSMSVYGEGGQLVKESQGVCPTSVYGLTKYDQERLCLIWGQQQERSVAALRFFNCYDDQTDILTETGFKRFSDLTGEERIATLNPTSGMVEYHLPVARQRHRFVGKLVRFNSRSHDICVTPEHRMYVRPHGLGAEYRFIKASELADLPTAYSYRLKKSAGWIGVDEPSFEIPEWRDKIGRRWYDARHVSMGDWCEFLGWYIAEGSAFKSSSGVRAVVISQHKEVNPDKYMRIANLCRRMGWNPYLTRDGRDIKIHDAAIFDVVVGSVPRGARNKAVPAYIKALAPKYLKRLWGGLIGGDGNADGSVYTTVSRRLADDVTEVAIKIGLSVTESFDGTCYKLSITEAQEPHLGDFRTKKPYVERPDYDGYVYDVTVPNHIIFVRRNGKGCWSSNCYGPGQALDNPYTGVLANFAKRLLNGDAPQVYEDGQQTRDFIYVEDVARAVVLAATGDAQGVFNVCTGQPTTIEKTACYLAAALGKETVPNITGETRPGDIRHCTGDPTKAAAELGFTAQVPFSEGIRKYGDYLLRD